LEPSAPPGADYWTRGPSGPFVASRLRPRGWP
jgi:hypothetical protein